MEDIDVIKIRHALIESDARCNSYSVVIDNLRQENAHLRDVIEKLLIYGLQRDKESISR